VTGYGAFVRASAAAARQFMAESGYSDAQRTRLQGDASTRSYERLALGDKHVILMSSPRRPDGPPVRDGQPYSAIAHLADNVIPFAAMADALRQRGFSAPIIHHADLDQGFLIIEDLGDERVVSGEPPAPIKERYETAVDALLALHALKLPDTLPVAPHVEHRIPYYDMRAFLIEAELLLDWFLPRLEAPLPDIERDSFRSLWRELLQPAIDGPATVLRDPTRPTCSGCRGAARSPASAFSTSRMRSWGRRPTISPRSCRTRVDVPEQLELALLGRYVRGRRESTPASIPPNSSSST
jgi:aminoglycoside/choline kinase family phosphotransferase